MLSPADVVYGDGEGTLLVSMILLINKMSNRTYGIGRLLVLHPILYVLF